MSEFTEREPLVKILNKELKGQGLFELQEEIQYYVGYYGSNELICIPKGYVTDLATRPWVLWWIMASAGKAAKPSILHDYLLTVGHPRAHDIFGEALTVMEVKPWRVRIMVWAVKIWAKLPFKV